MASGAGPSGCSDRVKGRIRSLRKEVRHSAGISSCAGDGESTSGGHFGRTSLQVELSEVVSAPWLLGVSSSSERGGQEIFSLRVSAGLSDLSDDPCPRASMVAVSALTLASGESSTVGLLISESATGLWILVLGGGDGSPLSPLLSHSSLWGRWPKPSS